MVVAYDSNNGLMEWYANIDVDSKSNDRTIMAVGDYISYINAVTSDFSVENQNYLYDCTIIKDIYDIDIFDELDGDNEYTSADLQRQAKSKIDRETLNAIEYHSYNYNLDYKVYLDNKSMTSDESILNKFNNEVTHHESYRKLERFLSRFVKTGQGYPYGLFRFDDFENAAENHRFLLAMRRFIDTVIDKEKLEFLVYTLIEILRQDTSITTILYGDKFIQKERLFGSFAHRKKICAEALLLGLLYHVHKNPDTAECVELLEVTEKRSFKVIRYCGESSLDLNMPINLIENIHETASRQKPATMKYQLELSGGDELPESRNIFIYGSGGAGKTTFLRSLMGKNNTVDFYFPLYRYNYEVHDDFSEECCHILLQILLKYHYQYEYDNYNALIKWYYIA